MDQGFGAEEDELRSAAHILDATSSTERQSSQNTALPVGASNSSNSVHPQLAPDPPPNMACEDANAFASSSSSAAFVNAPSYFASSSHHEYARPHIGLRPQFYRAVKDLGDSIESAQRTRASLERSGSSTRTAINTLFRATSPNSQPSSRQASFLRSPSSKPSVQSLVYQGFTLGTHIYNSGLLEGRHSDVTLNVFGAQYRLHRLILEQAPYFASTFSGHWLETSAKEIDLHPEETDTNITKEAFEVALKRIYGQRDARAETSHCLNLLPTACWLEMTDMANEAVENIVRTLQATNLSPAINLVTSNYYGRAGERILQSANILLRREGSAMPTRCWDQVPGAIVRDAVAADDFFVRSEWDRWLFAKRLLNRKLRHVASGLELKGTSASQNALVTLRQHGRLHLDRILPQDQDENSPERKALVELIEVYTHPDVIALYELLDRGIHYIHLGFEALQNIKAAKDCFGIPILPPSLIADALWGGIELRQKILNADAYDSQLGLSKPCGGSSRDMKRSSLSEAMVKVSLRDEFPPDPDHESDVEAQQPKYLIPLCDCNISIGSDHGPLKASEERKKTRNSQYQNAHAAASTGAENNKSSDTADTVPQQQLYNEIPPFRFSVEFPNPRLLDEKKHVHSETIFYAGSFWNIYIQKLKIRSKEGLPQLGVYLRRAEDNGLGDSDMHRSKRFCRSVDERIGDLERDMLLQSNTSRRSYLRMFDDYPNYDNDAPSNPVSFIRRTSAQAAPSLVDSSPDGGSENHEANEANAQTLQDALESDSSDDQQDNSNGTQLQSPAIPPYVDGRPFVKAYFKIFCHSANGRTLNIWESVPDTFSLRQSWGWRSSTLIADATPLHQSGDQDERLTSLTEGEGMMWEVEKHGLVEERSEVPIPDKESHLKFSIVIGLV